MAANPMLDVGDGLLERFWILVRAVMLRFGLGAVYSVLCTLVRQEPRTMVFIDGDKTLGTNLYILFKHLYSNGLLDCWLIKKHGDPLDDVLPGMESRIVDAWSFRALKIFLRAKVVVVCQGIRHKYFVPFFLDPKHKFILNLWHGVPLKRLNFHIKEWPVLSNRIGAQQYSAFVVSSELERLIVSGAFRLPLENLWITGMPRNDCLVGAATLREHDRYSSLAGKRLVLYAPTWRDQGPPARFFPFEDFDAKLLQDALERLDLHLLIRGHAMEGTGTLPLRFGKRILSASVRQFPQIEPLLSRTSVLITDYSSIYFDFLLLQRPVIFVPYDLEDYTRYRGFTIDYAANTPGPKVASQSALIAALERYRFKPELDSSEREAVCDRFHCFRDGRASQRIEERLLSAIGDRT